MEKDTDKNNMDLVLLKTVNNNFELNMIREILEDNDIPYIQKDHGLGGYMRIISGSSTPFETDILVNKEDFKLAKDIIDQMINE